MYFVTWRLRSGVSHLDGPERTIVLGAVRYFHGQRYDVHGAVIMDDHAHAMLWPFDGWKLEDIIHFWKSYSAHLIQSGRACRGRLWQDEYFDRVIRSGEDYVEKMNYMFNNPLKRWPDVGNYAWFWCPDLHGDK